MALVELDVATRAPRVAIVTVNDPDRRNALTPEMVDELVATFEGLELDPEVGAVVVTGAPPAFCAGADLSHLGGAPTSGGMRGIYEGFLRVARSPLPTIAAVNGAAVGAGMNLALCCDVRIAARRAKFDTRFLQLGLHPGGGHTWMLTRTIGTQGTAAMAMFGETLDGERAAAAGLVWKCVDDDTIVDAAVEMAARAAAGPAELTRRLKASIKAMPGVGDHDAAVTLELEAQLWSMSQPEFAERLSAMQRKIAGHP